MDVGERIKSRRKQLGLSAEQVAAAVGVSPATVYRYESNEIMNMRIDKLEPIAKALHTTPAFLMGWDDNPSTSNSETLDIEPPYLRLAREAQALELDDEDIDAIIALYSKHKNKNL